MDNQYNYYRPDSDENRGADNQQGFGAGPQQNPKAPKPKKGYAKKVALVVGAAVLFGAVGGVTMQGTSYLTGKLLGKNTKSTVGTTKTVSNAKLTTSTSTVTSDVSDIEYTSVNRFYYQYERTGSTEFLRRNQPAGE